MRQVLMKAVIRLVLILVLLAAAGQLHRPITDWRTGHGLEEDVSLDNSSPGIRFTTLALGGFRGIIADLLWLRVHKLQDQKRFFEIVQLSNWITKLEPRLPAVWAFHAWNMSYNISVFFEAPEERWRWVQHGVRLLRDDGIRLNPGSARLHWELAWLFNHKIGLPYDQASPYYQEQLYKTFPKKDETLPDTLLKAWRMDRSLLKQIEQETGTLDFRVAQSHTVYWTMKGLKQASGYWEKNLYRLRNQAMCLLVLSGQLAINPHTGETTKLPAFEYLEHTREFLSSCTETYPDDPGFKNARINFLEAAADTLRQLGQNTKAQELLQEARALQP